MSRTNSELLRKSATGYMNLKAMFGVRNQTQYLHEMHEIHQFHLFVIYFEMLVYDQTHNLVSLMLCPQIHTQSSWLLFVSVLTHCDFYPVL